ncbi:hypothetical protein JR316_0005718 [Psilocybe cubensis]|uniref:Uncharacterized protein n=2 Tax=Psilocybe cubensis TaxID=181762 RepID=A0ACB8H084_PSICU|nr:hypothetical protein JR316_0005718 [Psilocybe cubensis]KAH9481198.1 hypothetical protein JR316_0005718 [Psilocybe cubensis]
MPIIGNFSAWIQVDNQPLPEYQIEYSQDGRKATCWIPSEAGKEFQICYRDSERSKTTASKVRIDGHKCAGKIIYSKISHPTRSSTSVQKGVSGGNNTLRPFVFSHCRLVEDESEQMVKNLSSIGEIKVKISHVETGSVTDNHGHIPPFDELRIYERAKKGITHGTQLGTAVPREPKHARKVNFKRTQVTFEFRYRPIDILMADGIAPQPTSPPSVKRQHASEHLDLIDLTRDDGRDDTLDRMQRKRIKREVKQEPSMTYDDAIIDLTL